MTTERRSTQRGFRLLKQNRLRLLSDGAGAIEPDARGYGLYAGDTRFICRLDLRVAGRRPSAGAGSEAMLGPNQVDRIDLVSGGARSTLQLRRRRELGASLAERLTLIQAGPRQTTAVVRLTIGFDAADIFEVRGYRRRVRGELLPVRADGSRVRFGYLGRDSRLRTMVIELRPPPSGPISTGTARAGREVTATILWRVSVASGLPVRLAWLLQPAEDPVEDRATALAAMAAPIRPLVRPRNPRRQAARQAEIRVDDPMVQRVLDRALDDLGVLAEDGPGPGERFEAAGLPWFAALFGRDALLTGFESIAFRPDLVIGALKVLAIRQATGREGRWGAEPGRILHELRTGEMARLGEVPFGPSFGSVDATPLWLIMLGEASDWVGDPALLDGLWPNALRALDWIDARTLADPDGFLRYLGQPGALANEGWKDSPDAIRDRSGAIVPPPIALAEVQGYVHDAWRRMARMAQARGDSALAQRLMARARRLRRRFDAAFWINDRQTVALALGRDGGVADAISSNAGQCLWTGILNVSSATAVAGRILAPDMDSGWGIRTLGASEPAFDPLGYHTGSVWPHDTALIAGGLKQAGFDEAAQGIADRLLEAAGALPGDRLPELISGDERRPGLGPGQVPGACPVQAWASAAPLHLIRSLLGLQPDAALGRLSLQRPALPTAVGTLRISGLRVGGTSLDLGISRTRRGIRVRTLGREGRVRVVVTRRP